MRYFPLFADLRGRRVLVVGGGEVAERKARLLVEAGADVQVVSPELSPWLASRERGSVTWIATEFDASQLAGVVLVVAATNDASVSVALPAGLRPVTW